jgi:subtilisin family serine protease
MSRFGRRKFIKSAVGGAIGLSMIGTASAAEGRDQFVATVHGNGARKHLARNDIDVLHTIAGGRVLLVAAESADAVRNVQGVSNVEPNRAYRPVGPERQATEESTDEQFASIQWDKQEDTTGAFEAHSVATGAGRTVAIIDTGIDTAHPDLRNRVDRGQLFRADGLSSPDGTPTVAGGTSIAARLPPGTADEGDLTPDDDTVRLEPSVFLGSPDTREQPAADDVQSHGSHCAGIATAKHDDTSVGEDFGIAGMAPDADVVPLRVFYWKEITDYPFDVDGDGTKESVTVTTLYTTDFDILSAIDYAAQIGADAANMSLGGNVIKGSAHSSGDHVAYQRVIQRAVQRGTVVTTAAGNDDADLQHGGYYTLPNSVPGSISVSATGPNNQRVYYSNYGTSDIDVGAPGGGYETRAKTVTRDWDGDGDCEYPVGDTDDDGKTDYIDRNCVEWPYPLNLVYSTVPPDLNGGRAYDWYAGTSMAAPQVAGLVALVREANPELNAKQVQSIIENSARFSKGKGNANIGAGVVYAPGALEEATKRGGNSK